ncbi:hypothetical protein [Parasitella parasitica]|uniref:Uncharacterized protein n=1 Tax=Parasitella parasitica TaxID=35722 RepID=A0A0B7NQU9_9FUNG|nr:hypothetical protein [Parasitella parasitica]
MKKYEIVDGVEVVQKDPFTIIEFFVKKMDFEKKVRLAEDEHAREKCLEEFTGNLSTFGPPAYMFALKA